METYATNVEKLLVVEDDKLIQVVMKAMIEKLNYEFDLAQTGKEALEKANANKYNLILTDIGLPDIRGTEVAEKIRHIELNKNTPIVAVTGFSISDVKSECNDATIQAIYNKPLSLEKLNNIINEFSSITKNV